MGLQEDVKNTLTDCVLKQADMRERCLQPTAVDRMARREASLAKSSQEISSPPDLLVVVCTMLAGFVLAWASNFFAADEAAKRTAAKAFTPFMAKMYDTSGQQMVTVVTIDDMTSKPWVRVGRSSSTSIAAASPT